MNWNFVWWIIGMVASVYLVKFLLELLKSLFGKEARKDLINSMGDKIHDVNEQFTNNLKRKAEERKVKKQEEKKAVIYIR